MILYDFTWFYYGFHTILNVGFTEGYKNTSDTKKSGNKSHFFSQFVKKFKGEKGSDNEFKLSLQKVSNKKYLKLYKITNDLVNYESDILENSLNFAHENEDLFLGFTASAFEDLTENNTNELLNSGIDVITTGNHVWDKKETFEFISNQKRLLRLD